MTVTTTRSYRLAPLDPTAAAGLRAAGGVRHVADSKPGYPCRQCLRDAEIGDELILVSHDPFTLDTPYRSASPIFVHAEPCTPYSPAPAPAPSPEPDLGTSALPDQLTVRQLSVRAFDSNEMMIDAAVVAGRDLESTIDRFFDDSDTDIIHVHNASRGCWAVNVTRG